MMVLSRKKKSLTNALNAIQNIFSDCFNYIVKFSDLSAACLYHDLYLLFVSINNATAALPAKIRDGEK